MGFFVRQYRNLLPTSREWVEMTHTQIVEEYWNIHYWELRKANKSTGDETAQYETEIEFEQEMAEQGLAKVDGKWIEVDPSELDE